MYQAPSSIFLVRPASFGYNPETAASNAFQQPAGEMQEAIGQRAVDEFNRMVDLLQAHDIDVQVFDDTAFPPKPDAQFPNNWISLHGDGTVVLYPMMAHNRRNERRTDVINWLRANFMVHSVLDFSDQEAANRFLEGTGSLVFDYENKIAYACRSPRTNEELAGAVCGKLGFAPLVFDAHDEHGVPVYHTNVLMCVGSKFAVICLDAIRQEADQERILSRFTSTGHKVVAISYAQMRAFAGNMIEVRNRSNHPHVLLSEQAYHALLPGQLNAITRFAELIPIAIPTIEKYGGGSVRCMVAGNFLPPRIPQSLI